MIHKNVELHNVEEIIEQPDGGVLLQRVPESLRPKLNPSAQEKMRLASGCEIRFAFDGPACEIELSILPSEGRATRVDIPVFWGDFQHIQKLSVTTARTFFTLTKDDRLQAVDERHLKNSAFSHRICRLRPGGSQIVFHGIKGDNIRPPRAEELPAKRLLVYGTSITQGAAASFAHLSYAAITARLLGMDLINLGSGGSCQCEPEKGDYIGARKDWDAAVLSLSVNMRGFDIDEYAKRVTHVVNAAAASGRPVFCITLWPFFGDMTFNNGQQWDPHGAATEQYRQKFRDAVTACPGGNVHLLEGPELFTDTSGLTGDLIHPGDLGMMEMGRNLAAAMKKVLG